MRMHSAVRVSRADDIVCRVIVIIPAYNEEKTVGYVIRDLHRTIDSNDLVLVVDDGSTDNTMKAAVDAGADIVVRHIRNAGVSRAYETALRTALEYGADIICSIDADGQFNPSEIFRLLEPIAKQDTDIVLGSRFLGDDNLTRVPIVNVITNRIVARFVSFLMGVRLYEVESGFRAISKEAAKRLELLGVGSFTHDMLLDLSSKGFRIEEVPVSVKYFKGRTSRAVKGFFRYGVRAAWSITAKALSLRGFMKQTPSTQFTAEIVHESMRAVRSRRDENLVRTDDV